MDDIMVDIETTGTDPAHSHIIQISAVRFDLDTRQVHDDMFDQCLSPAPGRWWDEGTRDWWMGEPRWPIFCEIAQRMRPPDEVLATFQAWVCDIPTTGKRRLWAKPTSFEVPFLTSYFRQFGVNNPFHYRYCVDLNSFIKGRGHANVDQFWSGIESVGNAHNALHDVLYQIRGAFSA